MLKAGNLVLKALGAVSALYMMTLTTPLSEIIAVLRKAHVPKLIIELMNMIYRYIFIMIDTHSRMKNSAESAVIVILKHLVIPLDRLPAICWLFH